MTWNFLQLEVIPDDALVRPMIGLGRRAADRVRASHDIPLAREHRLPGQRRAVTAMIGARLAKLTATVQAHGYDSVDAAVDVTRDMSAKAAARATGLSAQTITRRRAAQK